MTVRALSTLGLKCPKPLIEIHRNMKAMKYGQILEVTADDPAFRLDIEAWCRRTGHTLLSLEVDDIELTATIRKETD